MQLEEKLSVIIPVYNGEKFLHKCLDSVINQTYKNLEIICIVDGATDSSADIIKEYMQKDNRIKLIEQQNQGVSKTRNKGIDIASGDYITFVDQDDYIEPEMYASMMEKIKQDSSDIAICSIEVIQIEPEFYNLDGIKEKYKYMQEGLNIASIWNKIFKKSKIDEYKIKFLENMQIGEDLDFAFRYISVSDKVSFVNKHFYKYVKHSGNNLNDRTKRISIFYCMKNSYDFINTHFQKDTKEYTTLFSIFNKLFEQHAMEYAFCNLPEGKKETLEISAEIKEICSKIELRPDIEAKLNRALFFYNHKILRKIWKLFTKKVV